VWLRESVIVPENSIVSVRYCIIYFYKIDVVGSITRTGFFKKSLKLVDAPQGFCPRRVGIPRVAMHRDYQNNQRNRKYGTIAPGAPRRRGGAPEHHK
jgi:hypothetical protein